MGVLYRLDAQFGDLRLGVLGWLEAEFCGVSRRRVRGLGCCGASDFGLAGWRDGDFALVAGRGLRVGVMTSVPGGKRIEPRVSCVLFRIFALSKLANSRVIATIRQASVRFMSG